MVHADVFLSYANRRETRPPERETPSGIARRVKSLAKSSRTSANRILVELIESGLEAREQERKRFFELADRLVGTHDMEEQSRLKEELARMTFGE
jgi:hypothetical protein